MLSAGPISHDAIQLSIIMTYLLKLSYFTGYVVFICASLLWTLSMQDKLLLNSEVFTLLSRVTLTQLFHSK